MTSRADLIEQLRWKKFPVLNDGFVCLVDVMGDDGSVVQAARVSYGAGTKQVSDDRTLIRYLMRHKHSTPFEMTELKLLVRAPMDCWRQWVRHRTACLAEGTELYFDLPNGISKRGHQLYKLKIEEIWRRFQPTCNRTRPEKQRNPYFRRDRVQEMNLRQVDEETLRIQHTRIVNVYQNGSKPVFRMTLADGKQIDATADHQFLFAGGWQTLRAATGLHESGGRAVWNAGAHFLYVNGTQVESPVSNPVEQRASTAVLAEPELMIAHLVSIEHFEFLGERETYDLEVEGPFHNFVANGIVTHNSVNEYSTRYSIAIDSTQTTAPEEWRTQAAANRQGSGEPLPVEIGTHLSEVEQKFQDEARRIYEERLQAGVAREQARKDLPLSTYTEAYWKIDLHNLLHFLALRMDAHAQQEIREYATTIGTQLVQPLFPMVWEAFEDYRLGAMALTRLDLEVIQRLTRRAQANGSVPPFSDEDFLAVQDESWRPLNRSRERDECRQKLERLGLLAPQH